MKPLTFFEYLDPGTAAKVASRREALRKTGKLGMAAFFLSAMPFSARKAFSMSGVQVHGVLNFALTLEYLEAEFYNMGLGMTGLIPMRDRPVFQQIAKHENAHVTFLRNTIQSLGEQPVEKPTFDFTADGMFADVFSNYNTFLALAQGFEDTGVRAYKGAAPALYSDAEENPILRAALQIHSVEARHASQVRRMRGFDGWISFDDVDVPALAPVYAGEENTTHAGFDTRALTVKSEEAITESFDEPLSRDAVLEIAGLFIVS